MTIPTKDLDQPIVPQITQTARIRDFIADQLNLVGSSYETTYGAHLLVPGGKLSVLTTSTGVCGVSIHNESGFLMYVAHWTRGSYRVVLYQIPLVLNSAIRNLNHFYMRGDQCSDSS